MARNRYDAARLEAITAAKEIHDQLSLRDRVRQGAGFVDVFDAIAELGITLVFKPLTSALGLALPDPLKGIMVTTRRGLHIQRFTAAHELGHVVLRHQGSVDRELPETPQAINTRGRDIKEVAADAFAAEFILPRWLYRHHIQSQGWTVARDLLDPSVVYQLSLRMGASYEATCWGLVGHDILDRTAADRLKRETVARLKTRLGGEFKPANSWADVWHLTAKDDGAKLFGSPDDLVRIDLEEAPGTGYQWQVDSLIDEGYEILVDESNFSREPLFYGAPSQRTLIARPPAASNGVKIKNTQPWSSDRDNCQSVSFDLAIEGPEAGGLSRASRRRLGAQI